MRIAISGSRLLLFVVPAGLVGWQASPGDNWTALRISLIVLLAGLGLLSGCAFYNNSYPQPAQSTAAYTLRTVQIDDFGSFWDPAQANGVLQEVDQSWKRGNTAVVVFIHGWHHNADPSDSNLQDFNTKILARLSEQLNSPERKELRAKLTGSSDVQLIGIYIGWRGRSLPGLLDYATMWWRKSAAERVGEGDASEFIERLQRMYLRANSVKRPPADSPVKPYMSLLTLGHSFGGQVLLRSVARSLEFDLVERSRCLAVTSKPSKSKPGVTVRVPVDGLGDINVLLNPAVEAYQFARIDDLYRQLVFPKQQTPQLVVFSADNDVPRKAFFPIARLLTLPFRPTFKNDYQGTLYGRALGEVESEETHQMRHSKLPDSLIDADYVRDGGRKVKDYDFTTTTAFSGVQVTPVGDGNVPSPLVPFSPVSVVIAHEAIIDGHTGIFRDEFVAYLSSYLAFVSGKRVMIRHDRLQHEIELSRLPLASQASTSTASGVGAPALCDY